MKKILAVIAVLAITLISSVALAEVAVSGSIDTRGRAFNNTGDFNSDSADYSRDTQSRVRLNFDGKAGDAKAKVTVEQDFETWGGVEAANSNATTCIDISGNGKCGDATDVPTVSNASNLKLREAWIDTGLFGPVRLKAGHLLAALGNGWFVRSMKYGSDAWIAYADIGPMHLGLVNVKIADTALDRDADLYSAVVTAKMGDTMTVGANLTRLLLGKRDSVDWDADPTTPNQPFGMNVVNNIGGHADLTLGPVKLKAEMDIQMGRNNVSTGCGAIGSANEGKCGDYKGNQIVIEGGLTAGPANIHFSVGRGTGNEATQHIDIVGGVATVDVGNYDVALDRKQVQVVLDADPHTSFLYEYKFGQPGLNGARTVLGTTNTGYANLTALSAGADVKLGAVTVGGTFWWLKATEDLLINDDKFGPTVGGVDPPLASFESDLGLEADVRVNWKISDAVSWNTTLGYFIPGDAYKSVVTIPGIGDVIKDPDEATGIQTVLSMKF